MSRKNTIKTKKFRKVIVHLGLEFKRTRGSHEAWSKKGMTRPVIFQATKKEIPYFIFKNNIKLLGIDEDEFFDILENL